MLASIDIFEIQNIHVFDKFPKILFLHILSIILVLFFFSTKILTYCTLNDYLNAPFSVFVQTDTFYNE